MPSIYFSVPGDPVAWARARRCGNHYFNAPKMANYETVIKYRFMESIGKLFSPLDCPIKLTIEAVFSMPQSATKAEKKIGSRKKITKPDLDNLIKIVGDGLNGVAWVDDAKIYSISAIKKETTGSPFVRIIIEWDI